MAFYVTDFTAGAYTNITDPPWMYLVLDSAGDFDQMTIETARNTADLFSAKALMSFALPYAFIDSGRVEALLFNRQFSNWRNKPLELWASNPAGGAFTGGHVDNTLDIWVPYLVLDLS